MINGVSVIVFQINMRNLRLIVHHWRVGRSYIHLSPQKIDVAKLIYQIADKFANSW